MLSPSDINEFTRLFKIPIPKHSEFVYYIQTLAQSPQYKDLPSIVERFVALENRLEGQLLQYKKERFEEIVAYVRATQCNERLLAYTADKNLPRKSLKLQQGAPWLVSVDIIQANFNTFKCFDLDNELAETWEKFNAQWGVDPLLADSRSFRQFVFGHLTPGRTQKIQHEFITQFIKALDQSLDLPWERKVFISPDEVVLSARSESELQDIMGLVERTDIVRKALEHPDVAQTLPRDCFRLKLTPFKLESIEGKDQYCKVLLDTDTLDVKEVRLFGVPGTMYYMQFKKHILQQPFDERDLLFRIERRQAKWIV